MTSVVPGGPQERRTLYVVGDCPHCGTGPVGVRVCGQCGQCFAMCDECDALWRDCELQPPVLFPAQPDCPCPDCGSSLLAAGAHWASYFELEPLAWQYHVIGLGTALRRETADDRE